jgi:hypothetical protein
MNMHGDPMDSKARHMYDRIVPIPVIDTHEHLPFDETVELNDQEDLLRTYLLHHAMPASRIPARP